MKDESPTGSGEIRNSSDEFRSLPNDSEGFRTIPNGSADFRSVRNDAESAGILPNQQERKSSHTLTVRQVARMFEFAGVSRTERSIVKWCQPNRHDMARLDGFFDPNERKWFMTPESVERAIAEEKAKVAKHSESFPKGSEVAAESGRDLAPGEESSVASGEPVSERGKHLEKELLNLKILNGGKDFLINQLRKERDGFIQQLVAGSHRIGQLESELRQLSGPRNDAGTQIESNP